MNKFMRLCLVFTILFYGLVVSYVVFSQEWKNYNPPDLNTVLYTGNTSPYWASIADLYAATGTFSGFLTATGYVNGSNLKIGGTDRILSDGTGLFSTLYATTTYFTSSFIDYLLVGGSTTNTEITSDGNTNATGTGVFKAGLGIESGSGTDSGYINMDYGTGTRQFLSDADTLRLEMTTAGEAIKVQRAGVEYLSVDPASTTYTTTATADTAWTNVMDTVADGVGVQTNCNGVTTGVCTNIVVDPAVMTTGYSLAVSNGTSNVFQVGATNTDVAGELTAQSATITEGIGAAQITLSGTDAVPIIDITQAGAGYDVEGTSDTWHVTKAGDATFNSVAGASMSSTNIYATDVWAGGTYYASQGLVIDRSTGTIEAPYATFGGTTYGTVIDQNGKVTASDTITTTAGIYGATATIQAGVVGTTIDASGIDTDGDITTSSGVGSGGVTVTAVGEVEAYSHIYAGAEASATRYIASGQEVISTTHRGIFDALTVGGAVPNAFISDSGDIQASGSLILGSYASSTYLIISNTTALDANRQGTFATTTIAGTLGISGNTSDPLLQFTQSGSGNDVEGTGDTWYVTKAGAATFSSISGTLVATPTLQQITEVGATTDRDVTFNGAIDAEGIAAATGEFSTHASATTLYVSGSEVINANHVGAFASATFEHGITVAGGYGSTGVSIDDSGNTWINGDMYLDGKLDPNYILNSGMYDGTGDINISTHTINAATGTIGGFTSISSAGDIVGAGSATFATGTIRGATGTFDNYLSGATASFSGTVSAAFFAGDGSGLTGVVGVTPTFQQVSEAGASTDRDISFSGKIDVTGGVQAATAVITTAASATTVNIGAPEADANYPLEVTTTVAGGGVKVISTADDTTGVSITTRHADPSPDVNDIIGTWNFNGDDSTSNDTTYSWIYSKILDPTNATETANIYFKTLMSGTATDALYIDGMNDKIQTPFPLRISYNGGAPLQVTNQTVVTNLNADLLDGHTWTDIGGSYVAKAGDYMTGALEIGGTGSGTLKITNASTPSSTYAKKTDSLSRFELINEVAALPVMGTAVESRSDATYLTGAAPDIRASGTYSISIWAKHDATFSNQYAGQIVAWREDANDCGAGIVFYNFGGTATSLRGIYCDGTTQKAAYTTVPNIAADGQWHSYIFTHTGGTPYLYFDGATQTTNVTTSPFSWAAEDQMRVAGGLITTTSFNQSRFYIDELRIYDAVLTADDVAWLYLGGLGTESATHTFDTNLQHQYTCNVDAGNIEDQIGALDFGNAQNYEIPTAGYGGTMMEAVIIQSDDGDVEGELGKHRFGNCAGTTYIQGSNIYYHGNMNIFSTDTVKIGEYQPMVYATTTNTVRSEVGFGTLTHTFENATMEVTFDTPFTDNTTFLSGSCTAGADHTCYITFPTSTGMVLNLDPVIAADTRIYWQAWGR